MEYNKIFFQGGPNSSPDGFGQLVQECSDLGIPVFAASSDSSTMLLDLQNSRELTGVPHMGNFIATLDDNGHDFGFDYNMYDSYDEAITAYKAHAKSRWQKFKAQIPTEFDPNIITISIENEPRSYVGWQEYPEPDDVGIEGFSGWADVIGHQAYYTALEILADPLPYQYFAFGFAGGNPQEGFWEQAGVIKYLQLVDQNYSRLGVALHEYSFNDNIVYQYGDRIGRFNTLHEVCDLFGIRRPRIVIKEWGWHQDRIPPDAMGQIQMIAPVYAKYTNIIGCALWTLNRGWQGIDKQVTALIEPIKEFTKTWRYDGEVETPDEGEETLTNLLKNPNFNEGWSDLPASHGGSNQVPNYWLLDWKRQGDVSSFHNSKTGVNPDITLDSPELVHKPNDTLPPNEQYGGSEALILACGDTTINPNACCTYKMFGTGVWEAELSQLIGSLVAGRTVKFTLNVQVHYADPLNDDSPDDTQLQMFIQGGQVVGQDTVRQLNAIPDLPHKQWVEYSIEAEVPVSGEVIVGFNVGTVWENTRSIFVDKLTAEYMPITQTPCIDDPREDYSRTYVLLPPTVTDPAWATAVAKSTMSKRYTIGYAADDAGMGKLTDKTVVAVNPQDWGDDLSGWFATHYKCAKLISTTVSTPDELEDVLNEYVQTGELPPNSGGTFRS